jgi:uncharacterized protein
MQNAKPVHWDGKTIGPWTDSLEGAVAVLNVVGESVFTHWTEEKKQRLMSTRVEPTKLIGEAIKRCKKPPAMWVNASAVGYYGSTQQPANEWSPPGADFLAQICQNWEAAQEDAQTPNTRKCSARIGFVLGRDGGGFPILRRLTKLFLGSAQGAGKQYCAWVHVDDVAGAFRFCIERHLEGPVNIVGPEPVTNAALMRLLRRKLHRPWVPNVPKLFLEIGSAFALPPVEVTLSSQRVVSERLRSLEYPYRFPTLDGAIDDLLNGVTSEPNIQHPTPKTP